MKSKIPFLHVRPILAFVITVGLMSLSTTALSSERSGVVVAQPSGGAYVLTRSSIDTGGGRSLGGPYELQISLGQPDAAPSMTGAGFELFPGFQVPASVDEGEPRPPLIFQDRFESN